MATTEEINLIKEKVNIYEVVSSYVKLKRSGSNYFGLCPFHGEKTPSFSVNEDIGIFKCFGCQESGDVIAFVEKIESLNFNEAIDKLAQKAGIHLSGNVNTDNSNRKRIIQMNSLAYELFKYLLNDKIGENAREYLKKRNISDESIKEFGLGYDHKNVLVKLLRKRGFTDKEILTFGLGVIRNNQLVDKYRSRLIFPIFSLTGEVVGFSGRILGSFDNVPKYLNSPETEVFKKNTILYGIYNSKKYVREMDSAILLEGPIDVISAFQNGVKNICAVQGTSLTINHINLLKRFTNNLSFCFDQDLAGERALRRSFFLACEAEIATKMIKINNAKDVDERVNSNKEGFIEDMNNPIDVVEYFINRDITNFNISSIDGKLKVIRDITPLIMAVRDSITQSFYISKLANSVQVDEAEIKKMITSKTTSINQNVIKKIEKDISSDNPKVIYLLSLFLQHFKELKPLILRFDESYIYDPKIKQIIEGMKNAIEENIEIKDMIESLDGPNKELCINLMTSVIRNKSDDIEYVKKEIEVLIRILRKKKIMKELEELKNKLWIYEKENNEDKIIQIMNSIAKLAKEI